MKNTITASYSRIRYVLYALLIALYGYISLNSFGYDDEYYNIRLISENSFQSMLSQVQATDVHPPLSYILNFSLFEIFHNWSLVRLVSAVLFLAALFYAVKRTEGPVNKLLLLLLLGFNPTVMLWGTSLRWYAYATPLLLYLSIVPDYRKSYYWLKLFGCFLVLGYLGYASMILFLPYFVYYWINDRTPLKERVGRILLPGAVYALAFLPQLLIFLRVHSKNDVSNNQQTFDLKASLVSVISSNLSNQGVFPLSAWGIVSIAGMLLVLLGGFLQWREMDSRRSPWLTFAFAVFLFCASGIAGKIRNLILLEPLRNLGVASCWSGRKNKLVLGGILFLLIGNMAGVYHVLLHRNTTKNAWNLPFNQSLNLFRKIEQQGAEEIYFTHSPTFTYHLTENNKKLISFYNGLYFDSSRIHMSIGSLLTQKEARRNFTFILTYRGQSISPLRYNKMLTAMNGIQCDSVARYHLGYDSDYRLKRLFFDDYPAYTVEIIKYYGIRGHFEKLREWELSL